MKLGCCSSSADIMTVRIRAVWLCASLARSRSARRSSYFLAASSPLPPQWCCKLKCVVVHALLFFFLRPPVLSCNMRTATGEACER